VRLTGWYERDSYRSLEARIRGCFISLAVMAFGYGGATADRFPFLAQLACAAIVIPLGLGGLAWAFVPNHLVCRICNTKPDIGKVHLNRVAEGPPGSNLILLRCPGCSTLYQRGVPDGPTIQIPTRLAKTRFPNFE
jgi:hypothetical protein